MSWARETPAQGNGAAHITVNDTVYTVCCTIIAA